MGERNRIETLSVRSMIIIAPPSNWGKTRGPVHGNRGITVADFKMDAGYSLISDPVQK
jgi:hypothetical protein